MPASRKPTLPALPVAAVAHKKDGVRSIVLATTTFDVGRSAVSVACTYFTDAEVDEVVRQLRAAQVALRTGAPANEALAFAASDGEALAEIQRLGTRP